MPPKRKQVDDSGVEGTSSTRSTRASTRSAATKNTAIEAGASSATSTKKSTTKRSTTKAALPLTALATPADGEMSDGMETMPVAKKARTTSSGTKAKSTASKASNKPGRKGAQNEEEQTPIRKSSVVKELPPSKVPTHEPLPVIESAPPISVPVVKPASPVRKIPKNEPPFTHQRALDLFKTYADGDDANVIGPEGFERLCAEADIPLDGALPLILAWQMESKEMAKITKEEWVKGTSSLKIASLPLLALAVTELDDMLVHGHPPVPVTAKKDHEYDRSMYLNCAKDTQAGFQKLYQFSFSLAKPEHSKNIEMETSVALWSVLLVPKYPIMAEVLEFINERGSYKATNKDLWSMMLEFCETVNPNLQDYEADGAWPTLLDDFVIWKKSRAVNGIAGKVDELVIDN